MTIEKRRRELYQKAGTEIIPRIGILSLEEPAEDEMDKAQVLGQIDHLSRRGDNFASLDPYRKHNLFFIIRCFKSRTHRN